jgi:hypothetical protein
MTYPNLKPCPHCKQEPQLFGYEAWNGSISSWRVECDDCHYIGSCEGRKLDAIREHNRRAEASERSEVGSNQGQTGPGLNPK